MFFPPQWIYGTLSKMTFVEKGMTQGIIINKKRNVVVIDDIMSGKGI